MAFLNSVIGMTSIVPETLAGYFVLAVTLFCIATIIIRYILVKTGKATNIDGLHEIIERDDFFDYVKDIAPVLIAEKNGGRAESRRVIAETVRSKIESSEYLTSKEKGIILNFELDVVLLDAIEAELIKRGLLPPEDKKEESG